MAASYRLATDQRNAVVNVVGDALDGGEMHLRSSAQPTNVADTPAGVLLTEHAINATAFGSPSTGVRTANAIGNGTVLASNTVAHGQFYTSAPAIHSDFNVGEADASVIVDNDAFIEDGIVTVTSLTMTCPIGALP